MIQKSDIFKMIKQVSRRSAGKRDKRIIHPTREWGIGLVLFTLVLIGGSAYNAYVYRSFTTIESQLTDPKTNIVRYQERTVETALTKFRARAQAYQALQASVPQSPIPDNQAEATTTESTASPEEAASSEAVSPAEENNDTEEVEDIKLQAE